MKVVSEMESFRILRRAPDGDVREVDDHVADTRGEILAILAKMRAEPEWQGIKLWAERLVFIDGGLDDVEVVEEEPHGGVCEA